MANSLFTSMKIAASGMSAQRTRVDVVSENIANAESTRTSSGGPYRRRMVVLQTQPANPSFKDVFSSQQGGQDASVKVQSIVQDPSPFRQVYDPSHPDANAKGIVSYPNVNPVQEMADLTGASRGYESDVSVLQASKRMFMKTLDLLR